MADMALCPSVRAEVQRLIEKAETGGMVANVNELMRVLEQHRLSWKSRIQPAFCHVHRQNRDGYGCAPQDVHELLNDILLSGWDEAQVRAICTEVEPSDLETVSFNKRLASGGLAPVEDNTVRYASLSASHTNQVLRLFTYGCEHPEGPEEILQNGRLCTNRLRDKDPKFAEAVEHGLQWTVLSSSVVREFGSLPALIQQSMNTTSQLQRREGELQLARRLHNLWKTMVVTKPDGAVAFQELKQKILRTKPACASSIPFIYKFFVRFGGGREATALLESEAYVKSRVCSQRQLGPDLWDAFALEAKGGHLLLRVRHALLRIAYILPEKTISVADVKRMVSPAVLPRAVEAEQAISEIRDLAKPYMNDADIVKEIFQWEMDAALVTLGKSGKATKKYESVGHAAQACVQRISEQEGAKGVVLTTKWANCKESLQPASSGMKQQATDAMLAPNAGLGAFCCFSFPHSSKSGFEVFGDFLKSKICIDYKHVTM